MSEHYNKAALSHKQNTSSLYENTRGTDFLPLPPQEATTRKAAISYDDNIMNGPIINPVYDKVFVPPVL